MGFEGYLAYVVTELVSSSPWWEMDEFQTLPVYRNPMEYDMAGVPVANVNLDAMEARALDVANRLGMKAEIQDTSPSEEEMAAVREKLGEIPGGYFAPTVAIALGDGVKITVGASLTAAVTFEPALELPREYNFGYYATKYIFEKGLVFTSPFRYNNPNAVRQKGRHAGRHLDIGGNKSCLSSQRRPVPAICPCFRPF